MLSAVVGAARDVRGKCPGLRIISLSVDEKLKISHIQAVITPNGVEFPRKYSDQTDQKYRVDDLGERKCRKETHRLSTTRQVTVTAPRARAIVATLASPASRPALQRSARAADRRRT